MELIWITKARYEGEYKIWLKFNDSTEGMVDLKNSLTGLVFEPLKEIHFFKNFTLNSWTIEWPNGADFSPEYLYQLIEENKLAEATK